MKLDKKTNKLFKFRRQSQLDKLSKAFPREWTAVFLSSTVMTTSTITFHTYCDRNCLHSNSTKNLVYSYIYIYKYLQDLDIWPFFNFYDSPVLSPTTI